MKKLFSHQSILPDRTNHYDEHGHKVGYSRPSILGTYTNHYDEHGVTNGIPVRGYCHWSLMDNFEWQKGYAMTFGLIAINRETMERMPKESLSVLGNWRSEA